MNDKMLQILGLAQRAGRLTHGLDQTVSAAKTGGLYAVVAASDVSRRTLNSITGECESGNIPLLRLPFKIDELWYAVGRRAGIIGITDKGFAQSAASLAADYGSCEQEECSL